MKWSFSGKLDSTYAVAFREVALYHNVRICKIFSAIVGTICLVLCVINQYTDATHVLKYPGEYSTAILFIFISSSVCCIAFFNAGRLSLATRKKAYRFLTNLYALIIVASALWITFVMQHNPSNTMSIFVLGILSVAALWIFEKFQTIAIALLILILFDSGLHFFQTDACKLLTNYITGTCVSIFFVFISRASFSVNYKNFVQLKKLEHSKQEIIKINQLQKEILGVVAHDLLTPVNAVISLTDMIRHADTEQEKNEYYDLIESTCDRSRHIIFDLLAVAKDDDQDIVQVDTCLNDFIELALLQVKVAASERKIIFEPADEKIYAHINEQKMLRVFDNLFSNAIKFTADDGTITVTLKKEADTACIYITDDGVGIPQALIPYLFNTFSQAGRPGLKGEKSHGLGMSICKLIMTQHNGDILASSEEGKGTQIKLIIPVSN